MTLVLNVKQTFVNIYKCLLILTSGATVKASFAVWCKLSNCLDKRQISLALNVAAYDKRAINASLASISDKCLTYNN